MKEEWSESAEEEKCCERLVVAGGRNCNCSLAAISQWEKFNSNVIAKRDGQRGREGGGGWVWGGDTEEQKIKGGEGYSASKETSERSTFFFS